MRSSLCFLRPGSAQQMLSLGANPKNPTFAVVLRRWKPTPAVPMTQRRNRLSFRVRMRTAIKIRNCKDSCDAMSPLHGRTLVAALLGDG